MKRQKIKIKDLTLEKAEELIEQWKNSKEKELELSEIEKVMEFLGVENLKGKGSAKKYKHVLLEEEAHFYEGIFSIHIIHNRKKQFIRQKDFKHYLYKPLFIIIEKLKNK